MAGESLGHRILTDEAAAMSTPTPEHPAQTLADGPLADPADAAAPSGSATQPLSAPSPGDPSNGVPPDPPPAGPPSQDPPSVSQTLADPPPAAFDEPGLPDVPGYEILGVLGKGGMGVVYRARQQGLGRVVALKMILHADHAGAGQRQRFRTEAEAIARLQHPHIVQVFEVGEHKGTPYFSLEFCAGGSLADRLRATPLPPREAAALLETLARAMQTAHAAGVVHRDLKPANVLLAADGAPKVTDFGLAKKLDDASGQTHTGQVLGTPSYMAPEQAVGQGRLIGPAADVYALGAILYDCLTGRPPFRAATAVDTLMQVVAEEPPSPRRLNPGMPRDLETICLKCLQKAPGKRYASAEELAEDLRRFREGEPVRARPVGALERGWRWCRRNPASAASAFAAAASLLAAAVVSTAFGLRAERARQGEAERARNEASAREEAVHARQDAQRQLIDLCGESGLTAAREQDHSQALLWFALATQLARDDPQAEELNRIRVANWLRNVCLPEGTFLVPGFRPLHDHFRTLQFSPDGNYLLVVASTGDCLVWDRSLGRLARLPEWAAKGSAAAWEPRGGSLAVAARDGRISLLSPPDFRPAGEEAEAGGAVAVLAFSRDGERLAWGGKGGARVWDRGRKAYVTPLLAHGGPVASLSFSVSGKLLATSAGDGKARVFRIAPGDAEPLFPPVEQTLNENRFRNEGGEGVAPRFADDDQVLLTGVRDRGHWRLVWRSAATGQPLMSVDVPYLTAFAVSPKGDRVAAVWEGEGQLWDAHSRQTLAAIPQPRISWCEDIEFAADGKTLVVGDRDTTVHFWSVDDPHNDRLTASSPFVAHPVQVGKCTLSADGRRLAVALLDGRIILWRMPEGPPVAYSAEGGWPTMPAVSPDRRFVLPRSTSFKNARQRKLRVYEAASGKAAGPILDPGGILVDAAFSPDGTRVAGACLTAQTPEERNQRVFEPGGKAGNLQFWDWKSGRRVAGPVPLPSEPRGLAYRPDGGALAVVCADYHVVLVDPRVGEATRELDPGPDFRSRPATAGLWWSNGEARFSPDGRFLATWEIPSAVHVWDPDRGRLLHTLPHNDRIQHVAFSPASPAVMATAGRDSVARVWDLETGKQRAELLHPRHVIRLRFSPDGTELLTSCDDGQLRVWDWRAGALKDALPLHQIWLQDFSFTADRRWLVTLGSEELQVTDWRAQNPAGPPWKLKGYTRLAMELAAEDRRAVAGGFSSSLIAYDLEAMTAPVSGTADDLVELAELAAGRRILNSGNIIPLTSAEWEERWRRVQRKGVVFPPQRTGAPTDR
jgi:WD40 repeat protein